MTVYTPKTIPGMGSGVVILFGLMPIPIGPVGGSGYVECPVEEVPYTQCDIPATVSTPQTVIATPYTEKLV
jgi:hypothetical protein